MEVLDANPGQATITSLDEATKTLLRVFDLNVSFRTNLNQESSVLRKLSFAIAPGEIVGLLGESGSGKTTTALSLMRLLPASARTVSGRIELNGQNLLDFDLRRLREIRGSTISIIYQDSNVLHPVMRVGDQVMEVLRAHTRGTRAQLVEQVYSVFSAMELGDCERVFRSYPHQLSGGQRRRVAIAQAIVCKPQLIIADEPTAWLDPEVTGEILSLFRAVRRLYGTSFLLVTHDPGVLTIADRVLVMYAGQIVEHGPTDEVLSKARHPYTAALLRCALPQSLGSERRRLPYIPGQAPDPSEPMRGCSFASRCSDRAEVCDCHQPALAEVCATSLVRCFKYTNEVESA